MVSLPQMCGGEPESCFSIFYKCISNSLRGSLHKADQVDKSVSWSWHKIGAEPKSINYEFRSHCFWTTFRVQRAFTFLNVWSWSIPCYLSPHHYILPGVLMKSEFREAVNCVFKAEQGFASRASVSRSRTLALCSHPSFFEVTLET